MGIVATSARRGALKDDFNLYAYVYNDPLNKTDPTGELSFVVARQAGGGWVLGVGHIFVVTNARYYGDPDATIHSFGPLANGNMGNISDPSRAAEIAADTYGDDVSAWAVMGARGETDNVGQILAPDALVESLIKGVQENKPYKMLPSGSEESNEVNSNSAGFAVGDTAEQVASGDPNARVDRTRFNLILPGQAVSGKVEIKQEKVMCAGSRIARTSC